MERVPAGYLQVLVEAMMRMRMVRDGSMTIHDAVKDIDDMYEECREVEKKENARRSSISHGVREARRKWEERRMTYPP